MEASLAAVIEDVDGTVDLLRLYNVNIGLDDKAFLPCGTYLAIKAPYYERTTAGIYAVRVDHPSDLIKLPQGHNLTKRLGALGSRNMEHRNQETATIRKEADDLLLSNQYQAACEKYTKLIEHPSLVGNSELFVFAHRRRALARLHLNQNDGVIRDSEEVLLSLPEDLPAIFYKVGALYNLRKFDDARTVCERLVALDPSNLEATILLNSTRERCHESSSGDFNFEEMWEDAEGQKRPNLKYADYIGPVEVRKCKDSTKGRGMFATRDIAQGELLVCEKALVVTYADTEPRQLFSDVRTGMWLSQPEAAMFPKVMQKIYDNPTLARPFLDLYSHDVEHPKRPFTMTKEGTPIIDYFTVKDITACNSFATANDADRVWSAFEAYNPDMAIFVISSYINHSCLCNVQRTCIGDFMVIRALRSLKEGEELVFSYCGVNNSYEDRDASLESYQFECNCERCELEQGQTRQELRVQARAVEDFDAFRDVILAKQEEGVQQDHPAIIAELRDHLYAIRAAHKDPRFCVDLFKALMPLFSESCHVGTDEVKRDCISDLREVIEDTSGGVDMSFTNPFEPIFWYTYSQIALLGLCALLEDVVEAEEADKAKDAARTMHGCLSGVGYENVKIEEVLKKFREKYMTQLRSP